MCIYFSKFTASVSYTLRTSYLFLILLAGVTALAAAAADGRMHVMRYLLGKGADPNKTANSGHSPLHHAAKHGLCCETTKLSVFKLVYHLVAVQTRFEGVVRCSPEQSSTPH